MSTHKELQRRDTGAHASDLALYFPTDDEEDSLMAQADNTHNNHYAMSPSTISTHAITPSRARIFFPPTPTSPSPLYHSAALFPARNMAATLDTIDTLPSTAVNEMERQQSASYETTTATYVDAHSRVPSPERIPYNGQKNSLPAIIDHIAHSRLAYDPSDEDEDEYLDDVSVHTPETPNPRDIADAAAAAPSPKSRYASLCSRHYVSPKVLSQAYRPQMLPSISLSRSRVSSPTPPVPDSHSLPRSRESTPPRGSTR